MNAPLLVADTRGAALALALRITLGRPLGLAVMATAAAVVLAALMLAGLAAWHLQPLETPPWMRPQALVLAAGAEGENDLSATRAALRQVATVASAEFIGRDAALAQLAQRPGLAALGLRELRPNPLPDAFVIGFAPGASPEAVETAVTELRKCKGVDSVHYQPEPYRRAQALAALARPLLLMLGAALLAAVIIGIVLVASLRVRLDPQQTRLLSLLGAEHAAICRPHVYAGALSMLLAGALAWWITIALWARLDPALAALAQQYALHWSTDAPAPWLGAVVCAGLALLGAALAAIAARQGLREALRDPIA